MNFSILCLLGLVLECGVIGQVSDTSSFPPVLTSFTCQGRSPGYYADLETGCKTYHVCDGNSHFTYVCPKRTLFQQRSRICDHSYLVRCEGSPQFYEIRDLYPDYEEDILFRPTESEENFSSKEEFEENYNETKTFIPTETTPQFTTESTFFTTDKLPEATTFAVSTQETTIHPKTGTESTTSATSTTLHSEGNLSSQSIQKFLKVRLKDFRSLFFIPEFDDNSIVSKPEREFLLPVEKSALLKFKNRKKISKTFSLCPSYCNPKFFSPGTCHPCIMIK